MTLPTDWTDDERDERHERRPDERRRRLPRWAGLTVVVVVLALLGGGIYLGGTRVASIFGGPPDYPGPGHGSVLVQVRSGDTLTDVGGTLAARGVVKSAAAFRDAAKSSAKARSLQPGFYSLRRQMSGSGALALLLDPSSRVQAKVTIPEGSTLARILALTAAHSELGGAALRSAATHPEQLGLPTYAHGQPEGFLFPATYIVDPSTSATAALAAMVDRFGQEADDIGLVGGAAALGFSPYDVVTVASLIEAEAKFRADYGKVARVVYNRLARGMPLQFDSTINYIRAERKAHLTTADTQVESAYNTYQHEGLPPTPIDSPGGATLRAALDPTPGGWLYFVTIDKAGHNAFADTYQEFLRLKEQARAAGAL